MKFTLEVEIEDIDDPYSEDEAKMLAVLCAYEKVYIIDEHLFVLCNDMFAWALADLEYILPYEIPDLFREWYKEPKFGDLKWVAKKRNLQPQEPVIEWIKKEGCWDEEWEALDYGHYNRTMQQRRLEREHELGNG